SEEKDIVRVHHGRVGGVPMGLPGRTPVEGAERSSPLRHVRKPAQPHEPVRVVEAPELPEDAHPFALLRLDELPVEELDEDVPLSWAKGVLPELYDRAAGGGRVLRSGEEEGQGERQ